MPIRVVSRHLGDVVVLSPELFEDERGFFLEAFRADQLERLGLPGPFVQENHSGSRRGVVRGLHLQWDPPMGKLMRVTRGSAFCVAVDVRPGSPTVGRWFGIELSADNRLQVWAPAGFARGFCALDEWTEVQYRCTATYNAAGESVILWSDPAIGIDWPVRRPILSAKDRQGRTLAEWLARPEAARLASR